MQTKEKIIKYPENIRLKGLIAVSGRTIDELAKAINVSRQTLSNTVNGHYKGNNIVPALETELEKTIKSTK